MNRDIDKVNKIYDEYKTNFTDGHFHNLLWQIIVNKNIKEDAALFPVMSTDTDFISDKNPKLECCIVSENGGYYPTLCFFNDKLSINQALSCSQAISKKIWNISTKEYQNIVDKSFHKKTK